MESTVFNKQSVVLSVIDRQGTKRNLTIAPDAQYNVMEILKTFGYKMRATCGGMGLCADCHCRVEEGYDQLPPLTDQEMDTLDVLPNATSKSRLSCQISPGEYLNQVTIELLGVDHY